MPSSDSIRATATHIHDQWHKEALDPATTVTSWLDSSQTIPPADKLARQLHYCGYLVVPAFYTQCSDMRDTIEQLIQTNYPLHQARMESFGTSDAANEARGAYFAESSNRIHYFANEEKDKDKQESDNTTTTLPKLNKVGHGLHLPADNVFGRYTRSPAIRHLLQTLGWTQAVVPQSMYIFKHQNDVVHAHQDSTFLHTTPSLSCLGLWLNLATRATLENGCLWVRPGSHREGLRRQYVKSTKGDAMFAMNKLEEDTKYDGTLPENLLQAGFVPVECNEGDLVVFVGTLDHLSAQNTTNIARPTFQLHCIDTGMGRQWSSSNWLQYPNDEPFLRLTGVDK